MRTWTRDLPIRVEQVTLCENGVRILDGVTLQIEAGKPTVLIGPNGSGKSALLRLTMGLQRPTQGQITWAGSEDSPPLHRSFVRQRPVMLRRSVVGNLRYALRTAAAAPLRRDERIKELLTLVGLEGFDRRPARRLSGGEQQRLALARALARDPTVLMLDEPTASLDPASTKTVEDVITAVAASGIKIVMSTHDLGEARRIAGDVLMLHHGRVIEHAAADKFFNSPTTQEARAFLAGELLV